MLCKNRVAAYPDQSPENFDSYPDRDAAEFDHHNLKCTATAAYPKEQISEKKTVVRMTEYQEKFDKLKEIYEEQGIQLEEKKKRIDYVLVHDATPDKNFEELRNIFIKGLKSEGMMVFSEEKFKHKKIDCSLKQLCIERDGMKFVAEKIVEHIFTYIHCPYERLCVEAENVKLEMRLKNDPPNDKEKKDPPKDKEKKDPPKDKEKKGCWKTFVETCFVTDDKEDYKSAPFDIEYINLFQNFDRPEHFFRPAIRSLLVNHILINMDLKKEISGFKKNKSKENDTKVCCGGKDKNDPILEKVGFPYMKMKGAYIGSFVLHDASLKTPAEEFGEKSDPPKETPSKASKMDTRKSLNDKWRRFFKFQPSWKIRDYFGEKIALYFAWSGTLTTTLWIPAFLGLGIFIFGLVNSSHRLVNVVGSSRTTTTTVAPNTTAKAGVISRLVQTIIYLSVLYFLIRSSHRLVNVVGSSRTTTTTVAPNTTAKAGVISSFSAKLTDVLTDIKEAFDNDATPFFALIICIWGTIFLEVWKRHQAHLACEWGVEQFEETEPDRPEFYGTKQIDDPVSEEQQIWYYPFKRQIFKFIVSFSTLLMMVCLVFISVFGVIVYRVIASVDYCPNSSPSECVLITTVVSSVFNAVSILILGKIYDLLAKKLTEWENHRTQTQFDDALIIKLFVFQFANNYASCFYIAFFRGRFDDFGILGHGIEYQDDCEGTCMSQLSFQVLILMISKPLPKFFLDFILPSLKKVWKQNQTCCHCFCLKLNDNRKPRDVPFVEWEYMKPKLGDFTLSEYTEKIIQYGFLMLFAASFPLAPLIALLTNLIDLRVDAKRMLWTYQRPLAVIREDIGMWYTILTLVNFAGAVSNSFLIAFTSEWGAQFDITGKFWVVIGFEHIVFLLKFILAYMIPDVPKDVELAIRKKKFIFKKKKRNEKERRRENIRTSAPYNHHREEAQVLRYPSDQDSQYNA